MCSAPLSAAKPRRVYRGADNDQRVAERRERLIAAAIHCFGTHGYHRTTLKMLCAEAGLTERYFYESFTNFDDILCCAYQETAALMLHQIVEKMVAAEPTPSARMLATLDAYLALIAADKARARVMLIEIEGASERANASYREQLDIATDLIEQEICAGLPAKPANGLSPRLLSGAMLGALYHMAKNWALSDFKTPRATMLRNLHAVAQATMDVWAANSPSPRKRT